MEVSLPSGDPKQILCLCVNLLGLAVDDRVIKRFRRSHVNPELGEDSHLVEVAIVQGVVVEPNHQWSLQNTPNRNQGHCLFFKEMTLNKMV